MGLWVSGLGRAAGPKMGCVGLFGLGNVGLAALELPNAPGVRCSAVRKIGCLLVRLEPPLAPRACSGEGTSPFARRGRVGAGQAVDVVGCRREAKALRRSIVLPASLPFPFPSCCAASTRALFRDSVSTAIVDIKGSDEGSTSALRFLAVTGLVFDGGTVGCSDSSCVAI